MFSRPLMSRRDFIRRANGVALTVPFFGLIACDETRDGKTLSLNGKTMGTTYTVKVASAPADVDADALSAQVQASLQSVDDLMSTYNTASELSRINLAGSQEPVAVSAQTAQVIETALTVADLSGGTFDPTIGPLVDLWGFGPQGRRENLPTIAETRDATRKVGYQHVAAADSHVVKDTADLRLDLSGVAKGFGVDVVAELLVSSGIENFLVEVGGEVRTAGLSPEDRPWRLGIEKPDPGARDIQRVLDLSGQALASSGNYRIFYENDGNRYAHIIDPRTGRPVAHDLASVTVLAPTTMEADALSTSMLVMGADDAMSFAHENDIAAFLITGRDARFSEATTPAFERLFTA